MALIPWIKMPRKMYLKNNKHKPLYQMLQKKKECYHTIMLKCLLNKAINFSKLN